MNYTPGWKSDGHGSVEITVKNTFRLISESLPGAFGVFSHERRRKTETRPLFRWIAGVSFFRSSPKVKKEKAATHTARLSIEACRFRWVG